jgi:hypothetical protein
MATAAKPEPISEDLLLAVYQSLLRYWIKQEYRKRTLKIWLRKVY